LCQGPACQTGTFRVRIGGSDTAYFIDSPTSMHAIVQNFGPNPPPPVPITIERPGDTLGGPATSAGNFTITSPPTPTITGLSPASGPPGILVTVTGTNFIGTSLPCQSRSCPPGNLFVQFGGINAGFLFDSATSIRAYVPTQITDGAYPITITTLGGAANADFTVTPAPPPTITGFSPASGPVGTVVTITGSGFGCRQCPDQVQSVQFNGRGASFTILSDTSIAATVPSGAFSGSIQVVKGGTTVTSTGTFTVTQ